MLVLTLKRGETVIIDKNIEVKFIGNSGGKVRLGFTAPESVKIRREEVKEKDQEEY